MPEAKSGSTVQLSSGESGKLSTEIILTAEDLLELIVGAFSELEQRQKPRIVYSRDDSGLGENDIYTLNFRGTSLDKKGGTEDFVSCRVTREGLTVMIRDHHNGARRTFFNEVLAIQPEKRKPLEYTSWLTTYRGDRPGPSESLKGVHETINAGIEMAKKIYSFGVDIGSID